MGVSTHRKRSGGFTQLGNEVLGNLIKCRDLSQATRILLFIIRKTTGFRKREDVISLSQFSEATGIDKSHVIRVIHKLVTKDLISRRKVGQRYSYWLNPDFVRRESVPNKGPVSNGEITDALPGNESLPDQVPTKETENTSSKDTIPFDEIIGDLNKKSRSQFRSSTPVFRKLIKDLWDQGFRLEDFKDVHTVKCQDWFGTTSEKYLRPGTLYKPDKFQDYLNQKRRNTHIRMEIF